ncbi:hypothetical protein CVT26_008088 [Gymnopilus dilepis]|uniref:Uncharacterized protein n=1 Tax=Gymnopilus dilepis TaxID=231916 RepID=A0A409YJS4_9AGAR|nr:hypothetical protein CVT26_008088 [Gymnopilus dilepis]
MSPKVNVKLEPVSPKASKGTSSGTTAQKRSRGRPRSSSEIEVVERPGKQLKVAKPRPGSPAFDLQSPVTITSPSPIKAVARKLSFGQLDAVDTPAAVPEGQSRAKRVRRKTWKLLQGADEQTVSPQGAPAVFDGLVETPSHAPSSKIAGLKASFPSSVKKLPICGRTFSDEERFLSEEDFPALPVSHSDGEDELSEYSLRRRKREAASESRKDNHKHTSSVKRSPQDAIYISSSEDEDASAVPRDLAARGKGVDHQSGSRHARSQESISDSKFSERGPAARLTRLYKRSSTSEDENAGSGDDSLSPRKDKGKARAITHSSSSELDETGSEDDPLPSRKDKGKERAPARESSVDSLDGFIVPDDIDDDLSSPGPRRAPSHGDDHSDIHPVSRHKGDKSKSKSRKHRKNAPVASDDSLLRELTSKKSTADVEVSVGDESPDSPSPKSPRKAKGHGVHTPNQETASPLHPPRGDSRGPASMSGAGQTSSRSSPAKKRVKDTQRDAERSHSSSKPAGQGGSRTKSRSLGMSKSTCESTVADDEDPTSEVGSERSDSDSDQSPAVGRNAASQSSNSERRELPPTPELIQLHERFPDLPKLYRFAAIVPLRRLQAEMLENGTDNESLLKFKPTLATMEDVQQAKMLLRAQRFVHHGHFANPALVDPRLFGLSRSHVVWKDSGANAIFVSPGAVANCQLLVGGKHGSGKYAYVTKKIDIFPFEDNHDRTNSFFGSVGNYDQVHGHFIGGALCYTTIKEGVTQNGNAASQSPKKPGLFTTSSKAKFPMKLRFDETVPMYDARGSNFKFKEEDFDSIRQLPLYRNGRHDLPDYSIVAVGYSYNTFMASEGLYASFNVLFVILLGGLKTPNKELRAS